MAEPFIAAMLAHLQPLAPLAEGHQVVLSWGGSRRQAGLKRLHTKRSLS